MPWQRRRDNSHWEGPVPRWTPARSAHAHHRLTLKQDDETLTGHYSSTNLGEAELTGTVKAGAIQFSFVADVQGMKIDVAYSGTVENNDAMKGTVTIGGVGQGTFSGKRQ